MASPSPARAWYAIFVFALALMMNFLDRGIVGLLVHPLEIDLHLTDSQVGLVTGVAYIVFYAAIGLPIARFADVGVRRTIVGVGVAVWSIATAFCGLAGTFWQLFVARMGVGAGEACNGPPVFSMISDLFPRDKLPLAIAVLNFGFIFGNGFASILGGAVIQALTGVSVTLPLVGTLHSWQLVFLAVGLPGLIVAALMATVKEPARRGRISKDGAHKNLPVSEVVHGSISIMSGHTRRCSPGPGVQYRSGCRAHHLGTGIFPPQLRLDDGRIRTSRGPHHHSVCAGGRPVRRLAGRLVPAQGP